MGEPDLIFYDAQCGLCQRSVRFLLARDDGSRFRFAPLGGATYSERLGDARAPETLVVLAGDQVLARSEAVLRILRRLSGFWMLPAALGAALPRPWRDGLYDLWARNRYAWFPPHPDACPALPPAWRGRFLP